MASVGHYQHEGTPDNMTIASESMMDIEDPYSQYAGSRKRKRGADQMSFQDQQHQIWADQLLDYFMLLESEDSFPAPPEPPPGINLDRPIDEKGHSAVHWASAMGDIDVVRDLMRRNARTDCLSNNLETPLMRAVMFTNNFDKQTMPQLARILAPTVQRTDWFGSTVFHHIAATTSSKNKYKSARYYIDTLVNVLAETWIPDEITRLLNAADQNGDTCVMIAARNGARKCVRSLLGRNVQVDRPNHHGETADDLIRDLNARRRQHMSKTGRRELSSSPFAPDGRGINGEGIVDHLLMHESALAPHREPLFRSATANSIATRLVPSIQERLTGLAKAFEQDYVAKAEEQVEIERVLRKRTGELDYLRKQLEVLAPTEESLNATSPNEYARLDAELGALEREAEAYLELDHISELRSLVSMAPPPSAINGSTPTSTEVSSRLSVAQDERRNLVKTIVSAMGNAGMGERQEGYKRLIKGAIGVRESEIESMLDEVLRELEEEARERGAARGGEGGAMVVTA
jgi:ankyrin repeat protein